MDEVNSIDLDAFSKLEMVQRQKILYARKLRREMRMKLTDRITSDEEKALCRMLALRDRDHCQDYSSFDLLPIYEDNVSDELIRKLELLSGPNAYAMLKALMARQGVT